MPADSGRWAPIRELVKLTAEDVVKIGEYLAEVKARLEHGQWLPWLKTEFGWSDQQARNFIHVWERFKAQEFLNLEIDASVLYLIAAPKRNVMGCHKT